MERQSIKLWKKVENGLEPKKPFNVYQAENLLDKQFLILSHLLQYQVVVFQAHPVVTIQLIGQLES